MMRRAADALGWVLVAVLVLALVALGLWLMAA